MDQVGKETRWLMTALLRVSPRKSAAYFGPANGAVWRPAPNVAWLVTQDRPEPTPPNPPPQAWRASATELA